MAEEHKERKFTNTRQFTLKCSVCSAKFKGGDDALKHCNETSHSGFEEFDDSKK